MIATRNKPFVSAIQDWLAQWLSAEFGVDAASVELNKPFLAYGMDSVQAMMLVGDLEAHLGIRLRPTLVWDYPNASCLAEHLAEQCFQQEPRYVEATATVQSQDTQESLPATAGLLDSVDNLTEEEVDALLRKLAPGAH